ncbi:hypothetical protein FI667_g3407, partial [Globisporangium splendens]
MVGTRSSTPNKRNGAVDARDTTPTRRSSTRTTAAGRSVTVDLASGSGTDSEESPRNRRSRTASRSAQQVTPGSTRGTVANGSTGGTHWKIQSPATSDFDGSSRPVHDWINHFEAAVEADESLRDGAKCIPEEEREVELLKAKLRAQYGRRETASQIFNQVMQRRKKREETFVEFAEALENLGLGSELKENQYIEAFTNGVSPTIRAVLVAAPLLTLLEACDRAY